MSNSVSKQLSLRYVCQIPVGTTGKARHCTCKDSTRLTIGEATKLIPHSESKLKRDIRKGKVSATKDESGNIIVDTAELQRVYGQLTLPEVQETDTDSDKIVSLLEEQVAELRQALRQSTEREQELLGLLKSEKTEKAEIRALIPPPEEQQDSQQQVQDLTAQLQTVNRTGTRTSGLAQDGTEPDESPGNKNKGTDSRRERKKTEAVDLGIF